MNSFIYFYSVVAPNKIETINKQMNAELLINDSNFNGYTKHNIFSHLSVFMKFKCSNPLELFSLKQKCKSTAVKLLKENTEENREFIHIFKLVSFLYFKF